MAGRLTALVLLIIIALPLGACATVGPGRGVNVVGIVVLQGVDQVLTLDVRGERRPIRGKPDVVAQLDRIVDARVACRARVTDEVITIRSFQILEAPDGMVPYLGRIIYDQAGVVLADETTGTRIGLRSADLDALKRRHGDLVWLTGTIVGPQLLLVAHWGVLVPASD